MAGISKSQNAVFVHDKVTAELGGIVAMGVVSLFASEPGFKIDPACSEVAGTQVGTFEAIGVIGSPFPVEQDGEIAAGFIHPLLDGGKSPKGNNEDLSLEFCKLKLMVTQLRDMLTAGNSAQMTEEDQQGVSVFQDFT